MFSFLDQVFLDNPLRSYLIVALVLLLVLLFKKYLSRYMAGLLFRLVKKMAKGIDKRSFVNLVVAPMQTFLLILVTIIALEKLRFPEILDFTIYKASFKTILESLAIIILIVSFIWLLLRIIDFVAMILEQKANQTAGQGDNQLIVFFKDFFKAVLVINGILLILKFGFDRNIGNIVTGLSITGAAIALSFRESLENLIASFIIFFDKPFTVGDLVKVHEITGTVEKIGLRSTRIRTDQKTFVTVPNKQMVDSITDNLSLRSQRRAIVQLDVLAVGDAAQLAALVKQIDQLLAAHKKIESHSVFISDIRFDSCLVPVEFFTAPLPVADFNAIRQEINLALLEIVNAMGLTLAKREGLAVPGK